MQLLIRRFYPLMIWIMFIYIFIDVPSLDQCTLGTQGFWVYLGTFGYNQGPGGSWCFSSSQWAGGKYKLLFWVKR